MLCLVTRYITLLSFTDFDNLGTGVLLILIRSLTEIRIPAWRPLPMDTSAGADLYRIQFYWNYVLSKKEEAIENDVFNEILPELTEVHTDFSKMLLLKFDRFDLQIVNLLEFY